MRKAHKITRVGVQLARELANNGNYGLCSELHRLAKSYKTIQEHWCNGCDDWVHQMKLERRESRIETRIAEIVKELPTLTGVRFGGDPRGFVVAVFRKDGQYDSWGGPSYGWGIA